MTGFRKPPLRQPVSQQGKGFRGCELGTDADAGTGPERQVLEPMSISLRGETVDPEFVRILPQAPVPVEDPGPDRHDIVWLDGRVSETVGADSLPIEAWDR